MNGIFILLFALRKHEDFTVASCEDTCMMRLFWHLLHLYWYLHQIMLLIFSVCVADVFKQAGTDYPSGQPKIPVLVGFHMEVVFP